jgi:NodT family efflux transporter outer membrane factor (OMF) lipoprotein
MNLTDGVARSVRFLQLAPALVLSLTVTACGSAPPVAPPQLDIDIPSASWGVQDSAGVAAIADSVLLDLRWWESFGDSTLNGLVEEALVSNYDLQAAAARVEQALAAARITRSEGLPQVDGGLSAQRSKQNFLGFPIPGTGGGPTTNTTSIYNLSADLSWEIDLWGRVRDATSASLADAQAAAADYAGAQLSLSGTTSKAWFRVLEARYQYELSVETVATFERTVDATRSRFARGLTSALDLRLALVDYNSALALREIRMQQLDTAERQVEILLGRYPRADLVQQELLPRWVEPVPAGLPADLVARRPDLIAAERRLTASGLRVSSAKKNLLPRIALTGSGGTRAEDFGDLLDGDFGVWNLVGNLVQPIFQGGRLRAQVQQTEASERELLSNYANVALRAFFEVETALYAERQLREQELHLREASDQAKAAAELAQDRYRSGLSDLVTLLIAQRRAFDAESSWIDVRRAQLDARVDLVLALGGGFALPVDPEDEEQPYQFELADPIAGEASR